MIATYGDGPTRRPDLEAGDGGNADPRSARNRPSHGYDIARLIAARSSGAVAFHVASLYPILYRLERRGLIAGRWVEKPGQLRRGYYTLTPQGRKLLATKRRTWSAFIHAIHAAAGLVYASFHAFVRSRLEPLQLPPDRELKIVEELAAQLEDSYDALLSGGLSDADAWRELRLSLPDPKTFAAGVLDAEAAIVRRRIRLGADRSRFESRAHSCGSADAVRGRRSPRRLPAADQGPRLYRDDPPDARDLPRR